MVHVLLNCSTISLYPDFEISAREVSELGPRKLKELKKERLAQIQKAIEQNQELRVKNKYYILLPTEEAHHSFHETKEQLDTHRRYIQN